MMLITYCCACWADDTPPSTPVVTDDGDYLVGTNQLHFTWTECFDPESDIVEYMYGIGTSPGMGDVLDFESAGLNREVTRSDLSLTSGTTYYFSVFAISGGGHGEIGSSDGITYYDALPTTPTVTDDGQYWTDKTQLHASWSSIDPIDGIAEYQYAIGTSEEGPGDDYVVPWTSVGTATEVTKTGLNLEGGRKHYFYVKARNSANVWSAVGVSDGILVDPWPPGTYTVGLTPARTVLHCGWAAADGQTPIVEYEYAVGTSPIPRDQNGNVDEQAFYALDFLIDPASAGIGTSADHTSIDISSSTSDYYFYVRAKNAAGLWSEWVQSDPITPPVAWTATYECIGLYWAPPGRTGAQCTVLYRRYPDGEWKDAMDLWYDARTGEYRGSIVNLSPGTTYHIKLETTDANDQAITTTITANTNSDVFPISRVKPVQTADSLQEADSTLAITEGGTAGQYVVYEPAPGDDGIIDVQGGAANCVTIEAPFVILRGFTLRGAAEDAIALDPRRKGEVHDVVIENCDISGWGRPREDSYPLWGRNLDAAIKCVDRRLARVTIQRNKIHHPRYDTNSWAEKWDETSQTVVPVSVANQVHPAGPHAVFLQDSAGNHVIRYNEIYSDFDHYFNDCLGALSNFSYRGFPGTDSDIYGNYIANCWDDGIESEGSNRNVRIWGNFIAHTMIKVAGATTSIGPLYVWRNVSSYARRNALSVDDSLLGGFFKAGVHYTYAGGRAYIFNNTLLQPDWPPEMIPPGPIPKNMPSTAGCSGGLGGSCNMFSLNNILHLSNRSGTSLYPVPSGPVCDEAPSYNYDFYCGNVPAGAETEGIDLEVETTEPKYSGTPSYDLVDTDGSLTGSFALATDSLGHDAGCVIKNFTDNYVGVGPDIGAHENGTAPMQFGVKAGYVVVPQVAKVKRDGTPVCLQGVVVTALIDADGDQNCDFFYVEQQDRSSGIRVTADSLPAELAVGKIVDVTGVLGTDSTSNERLVDASDIYVSPTSSPVGSLGMNNRSLGGDDIESAGPFQCGVLNNDGGLNNIGLLVQVWGRVTSIGSGYLYITDGFDTGGVRVESPGIPYGLDPNIDVDDYVTVTGISSLRNNRRAVLVSSCDDVDLLSCTVDSTSDLVEEQWNPHSLWGIPCDPGAARVFGGMSLVSNLRRWNAGAQQWVYYAVYHGVDMYGACLVGDGFELFVPTSGNTGYSYLRSPIEGDQWISLPRGAGNDMTLIGNPFGTDVPWSQCSVTNGIETKSLLSAISSNWIEKIQEWDGNSWEDVTDFGSGYMGFKEAYRVFSNVDKLALIVPDLN